MQGCIHCVDNIVTLWLLCEHQKLVVHGCVHRDVVATLCKQHQKLVVQGCVHCVDNIVTLWLLCVNNIRSLLCRGVHTVSITSSVFVAALCKQHHKLVVQGCVYCVDNIMTLWLLCEHQKLVVQGCVHCVDNGVTFWLLCDFVNVRSLLCRVSITASRCVCGNNIVTL